MRLFFFVLFFITSCHPQLEKPYPQNTEFKESSKNWEYLYSLELQSALRNEDDAAFFFFWPYYLQERYRNKLKSAGYEVFK